MNLHPNAPACAAFGLGLVLTLALAARLTPRHWWRRPNLRALAVTAGGTLAFGLLLAPLLAALVETRAPAGAAPMPAMPASLPAQDLPTARQAARPVEGAAYLVVADLNLRMDTGVGAPRMTVLRAGSRVTANGATNGDWWRVRTRAGGRALDGWASSLWLRRIDEAGRRP